MGRNLTVLGRMTLAGIFLGGFLACPKPAPAPRPNLDLSYFPSDVLFVAYADTVHLKESPLYRAWDARVPEGPDRLTEAKTFLRRLGIDPEKDLDGVMVAYRLSPDTGGNWLALLRGRFDLGRMTKGLEEPSARMSARPYGRWTVYSLALVPGVGEVSLAMVDPSAIALGKVTTLKKVLDTRDAPQQSLSANAMMRQLVSNLPSSAQIGAFLDGRSLSRALQDQRGSLPQGLNAPVTSNLSSIVSADFSATLTADLVLRLEIGSDSPKHAQSLSDALKGILGFARLGQGVKDPDLARLVDAVRVDGQGERVVLRLDVPGDLAKRLEAGKKDDGDREGAATR